ncbi:alginate lyase [Pedobacter sp. LMG 31464]|uniref:Alginate lyase n=1 Tax=Pedobacter planticolens TaxID=2679964 RepID=A0A923E0Z3_9SPHI|nr:alginate lyase family protein [Pedobacter planticolens]MBB2146073.1 alginate lyase [Pedobacter planticolens]
MKKLILFSIFCFLCSASKAQVVSLSTAELTKLKDLINSDSKVEMYSIDLLLTANASLTATPNPADTILTEGILQGDPRKIKTAKCLEDMQKIYALAFVYKITGDKKYLDKTSEFLLVWAQRNQPQGNPINDTNLDRIIFAYDLVKSDLATDVNSAVINWLSKVALQEIKTYNEKVKSKSATYFNNWNSHRIKEVAEVAWAINDEQLKTWVIENYKKQISKNLMPDGSSHDFHERDALHYHIYDVDPLMVAATILKRDGKFGENPYSYKSPEGNSLKNSVDWLVPFFTGEKTHAEFVNSKAAFDKKRAANGEKGYIAGTLFKPQEAKTSIALANYFDKEMLTFYQANINAKLKYPSWQFVLNEVKK